MPGFNYGGGVGDGTSWSKERGTGPEPGGGYNGHAGDHDNNSGGSGSSHASWAGSGPLNTTLINSAISEALQNQLVRNTLPATSTPAYKVMRAAFDALPVEQQPAARDQITQAWQRAHDAMPDKITTEHETGGRNGHTIYSTTNNQTKINLGNIIPLVTSDLNQALAQHQSADALQKSSEIIADAGEKIGAYLGDKYKAVAKEIAADIKSFQGKTLRSFDDAMKSLNKITSNPAMHINQADRDALVNAWQHVNVQDMANKFANLSSAFKVADTVIKIEKVREKSIVGYQTGNWGPLMLEVESWVVSGMAAGVAIGILSISAPVIAATFGIPVTAITIAGILGIGYLASFIDDSVVDEINNQLIPSAH
ncbi:colicin-like pore-forming protein [Enterobacter sp. A103]|uniref:colicin-like pore-forming protein n=1 Tax=Enterobacter sp. A103 TaxID=3102785 RepID=UPI002ACA2504|nr:colicin-like pore-forming protein [Enterobacter sp. A103]MDZ5641837.1 colicin-like pore-forming protein [Enterobacter sp. A103]